MCNFFFSIFLTYNKHVYACVSKIKDETNYIQQMLNIFSHISSS